MRRLTTHLTMFAAMLAVSVVSQAAEKAEGDALALKAHNILQMRCFKCHGSNFEVPGLNVLDRESLVQQKPNELPYITPQAPEKSALFLRIQHDNPDLRMPPKDRKQEPMTDDEIETIRAWILAGAWSPGSQGRPFITTKQTLQTILKDLRDLELNNRNTLQFQRYFVLTHLHNNQTVTDREMRLYQAAFVKLVHSLSWSTQPGKVTMVDPAGTIFRVDLRKTDWDLATWRKVLKDYPYGLDFFDAELQQISKAINELTDPLQNDGIPFLRADWFVARASRPPAYHDLLGIPETLAELEKKLEVNSQQDFLQDNLLRAGFAGSGVSRHNRLIDRHIGQNTAYYYKSFDFLNSFGRGVLFRFPLGPKFEGNKFNDLAFEHAGNEMVFSLPNGMQGYMITNAEGERIDEAPVALVRDLNEFSGSPAIVNGISCMGCHKQGVLDYKDTVADGYRLNGGENGLKVTQIFARDEQLSVVRADRRRFLNTLDELIGPLLKQGEDKNATIEDFPEPIAALARRYEKDLGPEDIARELGVENLADINFKTAGLRELGLGSVGSGHMVPRALWDTVEESPSSIFQQSARIVGIGSGRSTPR